MTPLTIQQVTSRVRDLPPLPAVVTQIIESMGHDDMSADDLALKISQDQALTAKTLRLANSSFYGMTRQIGSIHEAITILGMRTVRTVVTAAGITGSIPKRTGAGFDFDAFWRHSIGTALCAQALARELRMEPDIAFTVGLLHDIGRLALASCFADEYGLVLQHQREMDSLPTEAEQATLGFTHAAVGGAIAEHWRFSPVVVEAIAEHHTPALHHGPGLVGLVHLADNIAHALGLSGLANDLVPTLMPDIWTAMAPDPARCRQLFETTEAQFDGVCHALLM